MKHIVLATDGSEPSQQTIPTVLEYLRLWPACRLTVVYVSQMENVYFGSVPGVPAVPEPDIATHEAARIKADVVDAKFRDVRDRVEFVHLYGHPATIICDVAQQRGADLIVVGSHGRGSIDRLLLGSVSHGVLNRAKMSVLVAR
ncbi:MAG: universal stress protein [Firmicutes bacterium]|nr:universal stress protein [Bacillota bacterium]